MSNDKAIEVMKGQAKLEIHRSISKAMEIGRLSTAETVEVLKSAIAVMESGDWK